MARGPDPKDPALRQRRNIESTSTVLEAEPAKMPALGAKRPDGEPWNAATRTAWHEWWTSPIAARWLDAFVPAIRLLAWLHDDIYREPVAAKRRELVAELRQSGREFGLSMMSHRTLGLTLRRPKTEDAAARKPHATLPAGADPRKVLQIEGRRPRAKAG